MQENSDTKLDQEDIASLVEFFELLIKIDLENKKAD